MNSAREQEFNTRFKFNLIFKGILVGILSGLMATAYRYVLGLLDTYRTGFYISNDMSSPLWMLLFALIGGYFAYQLLLWAPLSAGSGIPQINGELLGKFSMDPLPTLTSKFIGGSISNFIGLSLGREGPSIQLGGIMGKLLAKFIGKNELENNYLILAGSSAGLAAAFNAPISGTMFALEEMYRSFSHYLLIPCMIASVTANYISFIILGKDPSFSFRLDRTLEMQHVGWVILLGISAGLLGVIFNWLMAFTGKFFKNLKLSSLQLILIIFGLTVLVGYIYPAILGGGHGLIEEIVLSALPMQELVILLLAKLLFTVISYNSGVQGGIFLPTLVLGSVIGIIIFKISGLDDVYQINFMIIGMAAVLTAIVRAPIMSIILVMEMTGSFTHLIMLAISAIVALLVAEVLHSQPIYDTLYQNLLTRFAHEAIEQEAEETLSIKAIKDSSSFKDTTLTIGPHSNILNQTINNLPDHLKINIKSIKRDGVEYHPEELSSFKLLDVVTIRHHKDDAETIDTWFRDSNPH